MLKFTVVKKPTVRTANTFCTYPFQRLKVTCEGDVTMCCFQERKCLGNLLEKSFEDIWFGETADAIREATANNELHALCKIDACPYFHRQPAPTEITYQEYPTELEIDLPSQHCNIGGERPSHTNPACLMCERHTNFVWQEDRLDAVCGRLRPFVKWLNAVHIQGVAEPFWKNKIFQVITLLGLDKYRDKTFISTTTNGTLMNKAKRSQFLEYPLSSLTWSIDAATPQTYRKIRRVDLYDKIIDNLMAYSEERKPNQVLRIHNNINLLNIDEVEGMVEVAAKAKVDVIDFNPTCAVPVICVDHENVKMFRDAQFKIVETAKRLGVKATFLRNLTLHYDTIDWSQVFDDPFQDVRLVDIELPSVKTV